MHCVFCFVGYVQHAKDLPGKEHHRTTPEHIITSEKQNSSLFIYFTSLCQLSENAHHCFFDCVWKMSLNGNVMEMSVAATFPRNTLSCA